MEPCLGFWKIMNSNSKCCIQTSGRLKSKQFYFTHPFSWRCREGCIRKARKKKCGAPGTKEAQWHERGSWGIATHWARGAAVPCRHFREFPERSFQGKEMKPIDNWEGGRRKVLVLGLQKTKHNLKNKVIINSRENRVSQQGVVITVHDVARQWETWSRACEHRILS